jgi:putative transcriptional regulator
VTIRHHIGDDLLLSYAAGSLAEGWSLAVATHLSLCAECRKRLALAEAAGGELLSSIEPNAPEAGSWAAVRSRLGQTPPVAVKPTHADKAVLPKPLRDYVGDIDGLRWQSMGKAGAQLRIKTRDGETQVRLLRIPAGKPVPEHGHGGRELTVVLTGAFHDGPTVFGPGDVEEADASVEHQPIALEDADCICLAVTDAPLKFHSWIVRLMQPILKI